MHHPTDRIAHTTAFVTLAGTRNSSMGPPRRIDPTASLTKTFRSFVPDYKLELTQDPPSVPRTFPFSLSCKIHKSVNLVGRIDFYRDIFVVASVTQKSRQCSEFTIHADFYSLKCGQGTDSQGSETKEYILSTRRSSYRKDSNLWTCRVADTEAISNVLVVVINSELVNVLNFSVCLIILHFLLTVSWWTF